MKWSDPLDPLYPRLNHSVRWAKIHPKEKKKKKCGGGPKHLKVDLVVVRSWTYYTSIKNSSSNNNLWKGEQLLVFFFVKFRQSMFEVHDFENFFGCFHTKLWFGSRPTSFCYSLQTQNAKRGWVDDDKLAK